MVQWCNGALVHNGAYGALKINIFWCTLNHNYGRGILMRISPQVGRFQEKLSAIARCPLYSMPTIDSLDCMNISLKQNSIGSSKMLYIIED